MHPRGACRSFPYSARYGPSFLDMSMGMDIDMGRYPGHSVRDPRARMSRRYARASSDPYAKPLPRAPSRSCKPAYAPEWSLALAGSLIAAPGKIRRYLARLAHPCVRPCGVTKGYDEDDFFY